MVLQKVRKLKVFLYTYDSLDEKEEHKNNMLLAGFKVEKEGFLEIEFSQVIDETE